MTINKASLRQDVFNTIFDVVNGSVSDPMNRGKKWIYSSMPDPVPGKFSGYPFIVINKAEIEKNFPLLDNSYSDNSSPIPITVFHTSNGTLDLVCDNIDNLAMIPANFPLFTFTDYNESTGDVTIAGDNVHFRSLNYFFDINTSD